MKQPFWKVWLSYLTELHVESADSDYNPHLYVSLRNGRYQLSTAKAIYSYGDLYDNFFRSFRALDLERLPGREALLLGLGLGSIPFMLEKKFSRRFHYTAVEIDEAVLYLAGKYVLDELTSGIDIIQADALAFVRQTPQVFDLICMDVFHDDTVPGPFEQEDFLSDLRHLLRPGGLLLYNRLAATRADQENSRRFFEGPFRAVFPEGRLLEVGGNFMLLSDEQLLNGGQGGREA